MSAALQYSRSFDDEPKETPAQLATIIKEEIGNTHGPDRVESQGPASLSKARRIVLVVTLACAGFLNISSVQSAVIMLPYISRDMNIPTSRQQWVVSAYNIAFGCSLILWSRLADMYGRRVVFVCAMAFVTLITTVIPFAPNEIAFDILRGLQGLGGAASVPSAVGILGSTFPSGKQRNYAFITYTAASSLGSVMGNIIGGLTGSFLTWKWVFWITAIVAACVMIAGFCLIPISQAGLKPPGEKKPSLDWFGSLLISTGLILLLFVLSEGNNIGWRTPWISVLIVVSIALIILFVFWQRRLEIRATCTPLVRMSMFTSVQFSASFVVIMFFFASYNSYLVFATFFFQDFQGLSAIETTLRFLPSGIAGLLVCFVTARLLAVTPGFFMLLFASSCGIISPLLFAANIPPTTTYWAYGFPAMCLCISADILAPTINLFVIRQMPGGDQSLGGALIQTSNQLGRAMGLAIATAVETAIVKAETPNPQPGDKLLLKGIRAAEWVNVGMATTTLVIIVCFFRNLPPVGAATGKK